jgi:hypothetical protein
VDGVCVSPLSPHLQLDRLVRHQEGLDVGVLLGRRHLLLPALHARALALLLLRLELGLELGLEPGLGLRLGLGRREALLVLLLLLRLLLLLLLRRALRVQQLGRLDCAHASEASSREECMGQGPGERSGQVPRARTLPDVDGGAQDGHAQHDIRGPQVAALVVDDRDDEARDALHDVLRGRLRLHERHPHALEVLGLLSARAERHV